jgi:hypothetical protein
MIIHAAYEGPPFKAPCSACTRGNTAPLEGLSYTSGGALIMAALAVAAVGITLYGINGKKLKKPLAGHRGRRGRR